MADSQFWGGTIRKLWSTESNKLGDHLKRLDAENRRARFGHSVSDRFITDYAARMTDLNSLVYGYFDQGVVRAVAEMRRLGEVWDTDAEAAFSVERDYQDKGIGSDLMGRVIRAARNRGISHLYVSCLTENTKMQHLARKHNAMLRYEYGDIVGDLQPALANYFSLVDEAIEDSRGFIMTVLDLQARALSNVG